MPKLVLYYHPMCPFCVKVLNFIKSNDIEIQTKNISQNHQYLQELINMTQRQRVPVLFIDDKPLYESMDIIKWLNNNMLEQNK